MLNPRRIWASSQLPTLPTVAVRLLELAKDPEAELREVVDVIRTDPALSAKILKAANSSFFGFRNEVRSIDRAVPLLGTTAVTSLALSFSLSDGAMSRGPLVPHYRAYWMQSVVHAIAGELIGMRTDPALASEYFLTGLLCDIGRLAMLRTIPEDYLPVLSELGPTQSLVEAERTRLTLDHVEIGRQLAAHWQLPESIQRAISVHHQTAAELESLSTGPDFRLLAAAALSGSIADCFCSQGKGEALGRMRDIGSRYLQWDEDDLDRLFTEVDQRVGLAAELFNIDSAELGEPAELLAMANEQLVQITLREHAAKTQATLRHQVAEAEVVQLEESNRTLQKQALHDALTGLYNRQFFDETLAREVSRAIRSAAPVAVIFIDVDHFKRINDTYGHQFGDEVLQRIARLLLDTSCSSDVLARYGGEEFVILVSQPTERGIERLAERIRSRIESEKISFGETPVQMTVSLGAAIGIPGRRDIEIGRRLIAVADECLYEAKRRGRNNSQMKSVVDERERLLLHAVTQHRYSRWLVTKQVLDIPAVSKVLFDCHMPPQKVGEIAVRCGFLSDQLVQRVLKHQEASGERFLVAAQRMGLLTYDQVVHVLTLQTEDPQALSAALVRAQCLTPDRARELLAEYMATQTPRTDASSAGAASAAAVGGPATTVSRPAGGPPPFPALSTAAGSSR